MLWHQASYSSSLNQRALMCRQRLKDQLSTLLSFKLISATLCIFATSHLLAASFRPYIHFLAACQHHGMIWNMLSISVPMHCRVHQSSC